MNYCFFGCIPGAVTRVERQQRDRELEDERNSSVVEYLSTPSPPLPRKDTTAKKTKSVHFSDDLHSEQSGEAKLLMHSLSSLKRKATPFPGKRHNVLIERTNSIDDVDIDGVEAAFEDQRDVTFFSDEKAMEEGNHNLQQPEMSLMKSHSSMARRTATPFPGKFVKPNGTVTLQEGGKENDCDDGSENELALPQPLQSISESLPRPAPLVKSQSSLARRNATPFPQGTLKMVRPLKGPCSVSNTIMENDEEWNAEESDNSIGALYHMTGESGRGTRRVHTYHDPFTNEEKVFKRNFSSMCLSTPPDSPTMIQW